MFHTWPPWPGPSQLSMAILPSSLSLALGTGLAVQARPFLERLETPKNRDFWTIEDRGPRRRRFTLPKAKVTTVSLVFHSVID